MSPVGTWWRGLRENWQRGVCGIDSWGLWDSGRLGEVRLAWDAGDWSGISGVYGDVWRLGGGNFALSFQDVTTERVACTKDAERVPVPTSFTLSERKQRLQTTFHDLQGIVECPPASFERGLLEEEDPKAARNLGCSAR